MGEQERLEEAVASAWASIDGKLVQFYRGKEDREFERRDGSYGGYMVEARELIKRLEKRGFTIQPISGGA